MAVPQPFTLSPKSDASPDQLLAAVKRRKQSGAHLPGSSVGILRATAMLRRLFHLEANEEVGVVVRHHLSTHPSPEYDAMGYTVHDPRLWQAAAGETCDCVVLWWSEPGQPTSVYEEIFQLLTIEAVQQSAVHMPAGPGSTAFARVPASLTYNCLEGFDVNLFWSVATLWHTIGTSGVKRWDVELAALMAADAAEPLPLAEPPMPMPLPPGTAITKDTYHALRNRDVALRQSWQRDVTSRNSKVEAAKVEGNTAFRAGNYAGAVDAYTRAIDSSDGSNVPMAPLHVLYANRAAAKLKLSQPAASLNDAILAVELAPLWSKAHFRVACALKELGRYSEAKASLRTLLSMHPDNATALRELEELEQLDPEDTNVVVLSPDKATPGEAGAAPTPSKGAGGEM